MSVELMLIRLLSVMFLTCLVCSILSVILPVLYYVLIFFALRQGLYQFLRSPSSSSPPLPRSSPVSMDYSKFGTAASSAVIPDDSDPARWVCDALFTLSHVN